MANRYGVLIRFLPVWLLTGYIALALLPVALAWLQGREPRPWQDDLASGLALAGFAMLLMEFLLSGRFKAVSARLGMDRVMQFHQITAYVLVVFLLIHPFLYTLPMGIQPPVDPDGAGWLQLPLLPGLSGLAAWVLLALLVFLSIARDTLPFRYETWRLTHGLGAALIALLALHHTLAVGRYSMDPVLAAVWVIALLGALAALAHVHVVLPLQQGKRPFRVTAVDKAADQTWTLTIEPDEAAGHPGTPLPFQAGQFAWLKLDRPLFRITEHPFSISSAPADWPKVAFTIKEAGDFTDTVGAIPPGTRAYLDGPYGHFTLDPEDDRPLVLIAGGVGMAPIMSLLRELHSHGSQRRIHVVQGNRHAGQILHARELAEMADSLSLTVHLVLSEPPADWSGPIGVLDEATLGQCLPEAGRRGSVYYLSGPPEMIDTMENTLLRNYRVPHGQVHSERFRYTLGQRSGKAGRLQRATLVAALAIALGVIAFATRGG